MDNFSTMSVLRQSQESPTFRSRVSYYAPASAHEDFFVDKMQKLDKEQIWHDVLGSVRVSVSAATYNTWLVHSHLASLRKLDQERYLAEIGCASTFVKTTLESRYFGLIQDAITKTIGLPCDLTFAVKSATLPNRVQSAPLFEKEEGGERMMQKLALAQIRPGFTFENFAVSASNQLAHAAAEAVAKEPAKAYNPLFIWGGVGVGKTHLMHAVGHRLLARGNVKALACTGEDFTNDIVEGIRNKTTQAFRGKYRKLQALFVDDIQFIAGKDTVQQEFFHTFNAVLSAGGQVIMTSDKPPAEINNLEDRLKSRFEAGMVVDIAAPDFELRCAIVQIKSQEKRLALDQPLVQAIAGNIVSARKIEGFLTRLMSEAKVKKREIETDFISSLLGKGVEEKINTRATPEQVIDAICSHYSINRRALLGKGRSRMVARPRQVLMYFLRVEYNFPLEEVGRLVGGRDHSTVIHGVDKITQLASENESTRGDISGVKKLIS